MSLHSPNSSITYCAYLLIFSILYIPQSNNISIISHFDRKPTINRQNDISNFCGIDFVYIECGNSAVLFNDINIYDKRDF